MTPDEDECVAVPDLGTLCILPWDRRFAFMAAVLSFGGAVPFPRCTRSILKRQLERAASAGFGFNLGVETELYVVKEPPVGSAHTYLTPLARSGMNKPTAADDVESTLDAMSFLDPMVRYMQECGFGVFSFDHEGGDGQYEFDFDYAPALQMADRLTLFRLMAKQVAKEAGLLATFMPKPYTEAWGSGWHFNMSLAEADSGENLWREVA